MRLLLTGFEPFGGSDRNPSEEVARALNNRVIKDLQVTALVLPVDRKTMPDRLLAALETLKPDAVVGLGEAPRRTVVSIERVAVNLEDYPIPDNSGEIVRDGTIDPQGPAAYFTTLPCQQIFNALRSKGIPCELSLSAGSYLCNQMLYTLLHALARRGVEIPAGFIHLPSLPEQVVKKSPSSASMSFELSLQAVQTVIETITDWLKRRKR
jgi:pyroglutamyl-peptidase